MDNISIAIVVSEFNEYITSRMLERALKRAEELNVKVKYIFYTPGAFDMPLVIDNLLKKDIDALVTLGAVIKGDTKHDEIVAYNASRLIADLSIKYNKPVTLGISGPDMTVEQAEERINAVATRAVSAAITLVKRLKMLNDDEMVIR